MQTYKAYYNDKVITVTANSIPEAQKVAARRMKATSYLLVICMPVDEDQD